MTDVADIPPCYLIEKNWQDASVYDFTAGINGAQWAWQFLRRNPLYQQQWQSFITTWRALEADYGKASDRDFCQWKNDSRAWVIVDPECPDQGCKVDDDKVLIECHLGSQWGFYKFPPDPRVNDPIAEQQLNWRPQDIDTALKQALYLEESATVSVSFDLSFPLPDQIEKAKRLLAIKRRDGLKSGLFKEKRVINYQTDWLTSIRLLDALAAKATVEEIEQVLAIKQYETSHQIAWELVDKSYLCLAVYR